MELKDKFQPYIKLGWFYSIGYDSLGYNVRAWKALPYTSQWAQSKKRKMIIEVNDDFTVLIDRVLDRIQETEADNDWTS